jgi:hypothetical protein
MTRSMTSRPAVRPPALARLKLGPRVIEAE